MKNTPVIIFIFLASALIGGQTVYNVTSGSTVTVSPDGLTQTFNLNLAAQTGTSAPGFTTQPSAQSVVAPTPATFNTAVSGNPTPTCQWYTGTVASKTIISGATSCSSYTTGATTVGMNGTTYFNEASNAVAVVDSNVVGLTVAAPTQITYIGTAEGFNAVTVGPVTISVPAGTTAGDFMLAYLATQYPGGTQTCPGSFTPPSGWTLIKSALNDIQASCLYTHFAGASEPANYTWTGGGFPDGVIRVYRNVNATTPVDLSGTAVVGVAGSATVAVPALGSTSTANEVEVGFTDYNPIGVITLPSGWGNAFNSNALRTIGVGDIAFSAAGTTVPAATFSGNQGASRWDAINVVLRK